MEGYASNQANISFVIFFLLNVRLLLSLRLKFYARDFSWMDMIKSKKRSFRWTNGLLNMIGFYLQQVVVIV